MSKVLNFGFEVSDVDLQLHYYIHFRNDNPGKSMNPHITLAMG